MALATDRDTNMRTLNEWPVPVAAGVLIYAGAQVALNAAGYAVPGTEAVGLIGLGRAEHQANNTGGAAGAMIVRVRTGMAFKWENSAADAVTQAMIGKTCWIEDDETVSGTDNDGARSPAGLVGGVDDDGVWVIAPVRSGSDLMALLGASHRMVAGGLHAWAGGAAATDSIAVEGLLATDIVLVTLVAQGANSPTFATGVIDAGNGQIDLTLDQNGEDGVTQVSYAVFRA
ncbi:MAG: hypothetical protein AB7E95_07060 [Kiritimatiellales bacterium]